MTRFMKKNELDNASFIIGRIGIEAENWLRPGSSSVAECFTKPGLLATVKRMLCSFLRANTLRGSLEKMRLGKEFELLETARFRSRGEVHKWMYDRFSLRRIFEEAGFYDVQQQTAFSSYKQSWSSFCLDTTADGKILKPDSLFMEGRKPVH
jgi:hypothetical protein